MSGLENGFKDYRVDILGNDFYQVCGFGWCKLLETILLVIGTSFQQIDGNDNFMWWGKMWSS